MLDAVADSERPTRFTADAATDTVPDRDTDTTRTTDALCELDALSAAATARDRVLEPVNSADFGRFTVRADVALPVLDPASAFATAVRTVAATLEDEDRDQMTDTTRDATDVEEASCAFATPTLRDAVPVDELDRHALTCFAVLADAVDVALRDCVKVVELLAGLSGTATRPHDTDAPSVQLIVTVAAPASSEHAVSVKLEPEPAETCPRSVCPAPTEPVEFSRQPTASTTSSPDALDTSTVGAVLSPLAVPGVPVAVV